MQSYLLLLIIMIVFFVFVEKQEQSGFFWTALMFAAFYALVTAFEQSVVAAALLAGALSMVGIYSFILIENHFAPQNILFRLISDFDRYSHNFIDDAFMKVLRLASSFVKPTIKIQNGLYNKRYHSLKNAVNKAQWKMVYETINSKPNQRAFLIACLTDENFKPAHYEKWIAQEPDNALAYILYGNAMASAAWDVRGSGTADMIPISRFETFWEQLMLAQEAFYKAISLDKTDPEPFHSLITVGMGLQQENNTLWEHFVQIIKRDRNHYFGHQSMLTALTAKWGGNGEDVFHFARRTVKNLPEGDALYGLIPAAHIEQWLYYSMTDDDDAHNQYFRLDENRNEINVAFDAYYNGISNQPDEIDYCVLNIFAFCFYQSGELDKTRQLLDIIGDKATYYPWDYCDGPFLAHVDTSYTYSRICQSLGVSKK